MKEEELAGLERALRAAAPAPWTADAYSVHSPGQSDMFGTEESVEVLMRDEGGSADLAAVAALRNAAPAMLTEIRSARDLLRRIRGWDHLDGAADGPYWKREIDAFLELPPK